MRAPPNIEITTSVESGSARLRVSGELDLSSRQALQALMLDRYDRVLLDLSGVEFMDVAGLRALEEVFRAGCVAHHVDVAPQIPPQVRRLLELAGVEDLVAPVEQNKGSTLRFS